MLLSVACMLMDFGQDSWRDVVKRKLNVNGNLLRYTHMIESVIVYILVINCFCLTFSISDRILLTKAGLTVQIQVNHYIACQFVSLIIYITWQPIPIVAVLTGGLSSTSIKICLFETREYMYGSTQYLRIQKVYLSR